MKNLEQKDEPNEPTDPNEQQDQSVILNSDVQFENREIDPGFSPVASQKDQEPVSQSGQQEQGKQDMMNIVNKQQSIKNEGLGELDGTNPGSNAHPMDDDQPF